MSEVVSLKGWPISHPGNPGMDVVAALEKLLECARAGEITGIAYATHYFDGASGGTFAGTYSRPQVGKMFSMMVDISRRLDEF